MISMYFDNWVSFMKALLLILILGAGLSSLIASTTSHPAATGTSIKIQNPFFINIDSMQRLLLINFENDPDSVYIGFEPQVFADSINGYGHLIIGWRKDGWVDVYCQPELHPNPDKYDIAGKGLAHMISTDLDPSYYEVGERGVEAHYRFHDLNGREIELKIIESHPAKRKPFGLLAPMGATAAQPSSLPLILLHEFYFVRQKHTEFQIRIGDRLHQPDKLPILIDMRKQFFTRYSAAPLIANLNPEYDGFLPQIHCTIGTSELDHDNLHINIMWKGDTAYIKKITRMNEIHPIELTFNPPIPALDNIKPGSKLKGKFQISAHISTGKILGEYSCLYDGNKVYISMQAMRGWKPKPDKLSLRFLYTVAGVFRTWPKTYRWNAVLTPDSDGNWHMVSKWERTK